MAASLMGKPAREESPGSTETRCRITSGGATPGKCHRKQTADTPRGPGKVKGAEAPPLGTAQKPTGARPKGKAGGCDFSHAFRVGRARRPVTDVPDEWPSIARKGGDRTRLIGRLTLFIINSRPPLKMRMHDELLTQAFPKLSHASPNCRPLERCENIDRTHCDI